MSPGRGNVSMSSSKGTGLWDGFAVWPLQVQMESRGVSECRRYQLRR